MKKLMIILFIILLPLTGCIKGMSDSTFTPYSTVLPTSSLTSTVSKSTPVLPTPIPLTSTPASTAIPIPLTVISVANVSLVQQIASVDKGKGNQTKFGADYYIVSQTAYSPDGKTIAVAGTTGIYLYNADTLTQVWFIPTQDEVNSIAFSPDGNTLASGEWLHTTDTWNHTVRLWRVSDGNLLFTFPGHQDSVNKVAFSPDGQLLASASDDSTVRLWRLSDHSLLNTIGPHAFFIDTLAFSPDGKMLVTGATDSHIRLWQVATGLEQLNFEVLPQDLVGIFSPDGQILATASSSEDGIGIIQLWPVVDGSQPLTLDKYNGYVNCVAFSPDGQILATGSQDKKIRLWQVSDGKLLKVLDGHDNYVNSIAFSPDGKTIISGSADGTIRLWGILP
jgi:WD40 repeat protein